MRLRARQRTFIRTEPESPEKKTYGGRCIVIAILVIMALAITRYGYTRLSYVTLPAIIESEEVQIESEMKSQILEMNLSPGDRVYKGQLLVRLDGRELENEIKKLEADIENLRSKLQHEKDKTRELLNATLAQHNVEIATIKKEIPTIETRIQWLMNKMEVQKNIITTLERERETIHRLMELGAATRPDVDEVDMRLQKAKGDLLTINEQLDIERLELSSAQEMIKYIEKRTKRKMDEIRSSSLATVIEKDIESMQRMHDRLYSTLDQATLISPIDGFISQVHKKEGEVVLSGEAVLTVLSLSYMIMKAYLPQKDRDKINEQGKVNILLPGKNRIEGRIIKIYKQAEALPPDYVGSNRKKIIKGIPVEIKPIEPGVWSSVLPGYIGEVEFERKNFWKEAIKKKMKWPKFLPGWLQKVKKLFASNTIENGIFNRS